MSEEKHLTEYLDGFARYMESSTRLQPVTRQRYYYEVEAFALLNVLCRQMQAPKDKGPVRPAYVLEEERLNRLLDAAASKVSTGLWDRAMFHFLYSTGVRNRELTGLEMKGLDLRERMATVLGKGEKPRTVVFDADCQRDLEIWLEIRQTLSLRSSYVFCSVDGTRLSTAAVQGIVRDANKRAGFRKQLWPHVFRHTRITELLNNGMSLQDTAVMAGHTDVKTTMGCYHQEPSRLKEAYDKATA